MSPTRTIALAALLGTTGLLQAQEAASPSPSATPDPAAGAPQPGALPATPAPAPAPAVAAAKPSPNVTVNLINRLVEKGVLTKEEAAEMIQQAEQKKFNAGQ
jgi:hypothetical protein